MKKPTPFGKYYLLERINVGGMAEVFRAKAFGVEGFERLVAVKRILPNIAEDKEFIRMFIEEAKLAVQLNHANIAQIFDLGVVDGSYYIALEHVHGRDLRAMFDRCRNLGEPMPVSQACFVVMKVCEGLDYAHNKRDQAGRELHLVHRDVSPQNVLVSFEGEVKLIDFGIAKAAGKGSKTQAGILKGKFGYMSPEQVRGIPVDRRSDVFSCGIVLYELLTGERLFVGESDFSTLEKVRNVEILPPSTYNRRIPDELERIVLKALAKDPEDRYQNSIDLHDELQAFVYTAGEFYSRKDLAAWMKKTFGREIEEETAKLESYRQLKAPAVEPLARTQHPLGSRPPTAAASPKARSSGPVKVPPPPAPGSPGRADYPLAPAGRLSQQLPVVSQHAKPQRTEDSSQLAWDDDELETQIYDNPDDPANKRPTNRSGGLPLASPPTTPQPQPAQAVAPPPPPVSSLPPTGTQPDLSSLVQTGRGWAAKAPTNGAQPAQLATGSSKGPAPADPLGDPLAALAATYSAPAAPAPRQPDAVFAATALPQPLAKPRISAPEPLFDPMASFGQGMLARKGGGKSKNMVFIAIGGAAVAVVAVVVIIAMTGSKDAATKAPTASTAAATPNAPSGDQNTGFDLYVNPPGTMTWRLDGVARTDKLPSRIRGISPGQHNVAIDAPPGFMSQNMPISVELGKAPKVEIVLQPLDIAGAFESTPPGATVSLIVDGKRETLGQSPAKTKLDPRKTYQVLFEKQGYVSINRPIVFTGQVEEKVVVNLEKAGAASASPPPVAAVEQPKQPKAEPAKTETPKVKVEKTPVKTAAVTTPAKDSKVTPAPEKKEPEKPEKEAKAEAPKAGGKEGTLLLGSKPPCDIFIDGKSTGMQTPQKDLKLSAGKHKITLVNNEYGIKETFAVDIKPDAVEKQIKDFSDRIPK